MYLIQNDDFVMKAISVIICFFYYYQSSNRNLRWPTSVTAKDKSSRQKKNFRRKKEIGHGKRSSMVNEVIRTIFFFLQENFISTKSTKKHI